MRVQSAFLMAALIFPLVSCKAAPSLVGTWSNPDSPFTLTFNDDKTFVLEATVEPVKGFQAKGDYSLVENRLTLSNVKPVADDSTLLGGLMKRANKFIPDKPQDLTLSWKTDNDIVLDGDGQIRGAFTRVKQ